MIKQSLKLIIILTFSMILPGLILQGNCEAGELDDQLRLVQGSFQDGLLDLAYPEAKDFLAKAPDHRARGEVFLILGYIEKSRKNSTSARDYFLKATVSDDPSIRLQGYYEAASLDWKAGKFTEAADNYRAIIDENRDDELTEISRYWLILSLFRAGDDSGVITSAKTLLDSGDRIDAERMVQIMYCRGQSYYRLDRLTDSLAELERVFFSEIPEISASAALTIAKIHVRLNDMRSADLWSTRRLTTGFNRDSHMIRAFSALDRGDLQGARMQFSSALKDDSMTLLDRQAVSAKEALCESRIKAEAGSDWWNPLLLYCLSFPESPHMAEILAEFTGHGQDGNSVPGLPEMLENSAVWDPGDHGLQLANLHIADQNHDAAIRWVVRHFQMRDQSAQDNSYRLILARLLAATGDSESAAHELRFSDLSYGKESSTIEGMNQQAELFFQSGMFQQAASLYQEILVAPGMLEPERRSILFRLGESYFQMEKWILASEIFSRFKETYPDASNQEREAVMRRIASSLVYAAEWAAAESAIELYQTQFPETELSGEMYYLKGLTQANLGKIDESLKTLGQALDRLGDSEFVDTIKETIRQISERQISERQSLKNAEPEEQ